MHKNNSVYREMHKSHTRQENRPRHFSDSTKHRGVAIA